MINAVAFRPTLASFSSIRTRRSIPARQLRVKSGEGASSDTLSGEWPANWSLASYEVRRSRFAVPLTLRHQASLDFIIRNSFAQSRNGLLEYLII